MQIFDLKTAVSMSLLTDRRADEHELPSYETYRRGWWGDCLNSSKMGSKLWLLHRRKLGPETLDLAKLYTMEALNWLIQDEIADEIAVQCEISRQILLIQVKVHLKDDPTPILFKMEFPKGPIFYAF